MRDTNHLTIVMYHYVRPIKDSKFPKIKGLEIKKFEKQLDYLSKKYDFITAAELINYSLGTEDLPNNPCYLTFDDGYKDHIDYVMPELLSRNIQGSFFPPADAVTERKMLDVNAIHFILASAMDYKKLIVDLNKECLDRGLKEKNLSALKTDWAIPSRYDSADIMYFKNLLQHALPKNIRKNIISKLFKIYTGMDQSDFSDELYISLSDTKKLIENGMYVGCHGRRHIWLGKENKSEQILEIGSSLEFLKKVGSPIKDWIMCYPFGSYNEDTLSILKSKECLVGLTTKVGLANLDRSKMLELNRFDTNDFKQ